MKKLITLIITLALSILTALGATACDSNKFTLPTLVTPGKTISVGGMIAETENYLYYINGLGASDGDNEYGKPLKGSLMVVDKSTLGGEVKTEVVVPKLFVASDYGAGVYIYGEGENANIYYGTPSVDKDANGQIAKTTLAFMKTTLDGKKTEKLFNVDGIGTNYRIGEKDGKVYIVYYDAKETALKVFDCDSKSATVIAKTDDKVRNFTNIEEGKKAYLSLNTYKFVENGYGFSVVFDMKVYAEDYLEEKAESQDSYARAEAGYNVVYAYSFGDVADNHGIVGTMISNGSIGDIKHELNLVEDGYLFVKETNQTNKAKNYACLVNEVKEYATKKVEVKNADNVKSLMVINSLEEVYLNYSETEDGETTSQYVVKTTLTGDETKVREPILQKSSVASLLFIRGEYMYYYTSAGKLARNNLAYGSEEELVSEDTVSQTWYTPEIVEITEGETKKEYLFYLDNSAAVSSYVKFVDVSKSAVEKENADGTKYKTLEGQKLLGVMTEADKANPTIAKINNLPASDIDHVIKDDGTVEFTSVVEARAMYNALNKEGKEAVSEEVLAKLEKAEKAQVLANYYYKLNKFNVKEVADYNALSDADKTEYKNVYNDAKAHRQALANENKTEYEEIREMIDKEIRYLFQVADKVFAEKK